jgi:hypothetical protein
LVLEVVVFAVCAKNVFENTNTKHNKISFFIGFTV